MCKHTEIAWILAVLGFLGLPGCGAPEPTFSPQAEYTPKALADELVYRYQTTRRSTEKAKAVASTKAAESIDDQVATKAADDASKADPNAVSADVLVKETLAKAGAIKSKSKAEAVREIVDQLKQQTGLNEPDRSELIRLLEAGAGSG
jgi:hypothetical protein